MHASKANPSNLSGWTPQNPDRYNTIDPKLRYGSILGLRDLAREILEPVGVRILLRLLYSDNDGACIPDHQR